ncbi:MAG: ABC transporter substrate-binding protein [Bulleidia sp.]|nr:ABC transporter substrate-binding protein [Bulleidia sp.]
MKKWKRFLSSFLVMTMAVLSLTGCKEVSRDKKDKQTITVYLWSANLYDTYAPYVQSQLPDINVEFVVGNNDLDFYTFLNENGGLPDIITNCRFSLHDALPLKESLMDLSTSNAAGAVYNSYLSSFMNEDGSVNWLPVCADAHGFVVNKSLFDTYGIALPEDYDSFKAACQKFEEVGIRGFAADFAYDYTCMETLQGLSAAELSSVQGRKWRTAYSDPLNSEKVGLDDTVWPGAFERMEQFIQDTGLTSEDLHLMYDDIADMYSNGQLAMYFGSSAGVKLYQDQGIDTIFLPFFNQNGDKWLMTTPYFQVALNNGLSQDETRLSSAIKVLNVMLSEEAQNSIANGQDILSYSQDVPLRLIDYLKDVRSVVEENHMYIRIASNDFFRISQNVVSKMISGEYTAEEAYKDFDAQLRQPEETTEEEPVLLSDTSYSNTFQNKGGNEAYSVMANSLRDCYGSDVLIAMANSFTGNVLQAEYSEKMAGYMIMPNGLCAFTKTMSGKELKEIVKSFTEGTEGGFIPFNKGSLPVFSGISAEVKEDNGSYTLVDVQRDGKNIQEDDTFTVTCLSLEKYMQPLPGETGKGFTEEELVVRKKWLEYIQEGKAGLSKPSSYITLRTDR